MDRFIGKQQRNKNAKFDSLKSNMDRFIVYGNLEQVKMFISLKSNMDRFIGFIYNIIRSNILV